MISKLWFVTAMIASVALANPLPVRAQSDVQNQSAQPSPIMQQAREAFKRGDYTAAAAYMRTAAENGDPIGQVALGKAYLEGRGVPQNTAEGFRLMQLVLKRHQEPSYSLAVSALRSIAPGDNSRPKGNRDPAADILSAVGAIQDAARQKWKQMTPAQRELATRLSRPTNTGIMMCDGYFCY